MMNARHRRNPSSRGTNHFTRHGERRRRLSRTSRAPGVWPVPRLTEVQLALPTRPAKPLSPGNRLRDHLSLWFNGHTCTPTCPLSCHTARRAFQPSEAAITLTERHGLL
ncbi:hypothetical protein EYF80_010268 [Liparis tanakae]|uniref:Uncharacterized protein n=1 Tax=Liparis tanakae TaxID=230148 RepID=A0A4Z2IPQ4_9TELE|nr:hypothetical protein EYF80_010268 [Liparis tanakae]